MEVINMEIYKEVEKFMLDNNINLDKKGIIANANMCAIVSKFINYKYTVTEILLIYDFITDVLQDKIPQVMLNISKEDRIPTAIKLLDKNYISFYKDDLTEEEKEKFAFCIIYSFFVYSFDEKTEEMEQGIYDFTSFERIEKEYIYEKETYPSKFVIKKYSDDSKENYGLVIDNPIEVTSVGLEYQYLDSIQTKDNKEITYERIGSFTGKDNIHIDGYDIFVKGLLGKKKVATFYISGYGNSNATKTPKGFKFI